MYAKGVKEESQGVCVTIKAKDLLSMVGSKTSGELVIVQVELSDLDTIIIATKDVTRAVYSKTYGGTYVFDEDNKPTSSSARLKLVAKIEGDDLKNVDVTSLATFNGLELTVDELESITTS